MSNQPTITTLVEDIYHLFDPDVPHTPNEANLDEFADNLKEILRARLGQREKNDNPLRFSALGKPDRQIWYDAHPDGTKEGFTAKTYFKFLYGDVIEQLVLFLAKEAGHVVERTQEEIEVDGVKGHIDAIIDGVVVDVKSASPYSYKKFKAQTITEDDPFGYVQQLAGYSETLTPGQGAAWVAFDKVHGDICVSPLSATITREHRPAERIAHLKEVIGNPEPPARCYSDEPDGKSGNRKLPTACSYCSHKWRCWPNLRGFMYASSPRFLTKVVNEPNVPEIKRETPVEEET